MRKVARGEAESSAGERLAVGAQTQGFASRWQPEARASGQECEFFPEVPRLVLQSRLGPRAPWEFRRVKVLGAQRKASAAAVMREHQVVLPLGGEPLGPLPAASLA